MDQECMQIEFCHFSGKVPFGEHKISAWGKASGIEILQNWCHLRPTKQHLRNSQDMAVTWKGDSFVGQ